MCFDGRLDPILLSALLLARTGGGEGGESKGMVFQPFWSYLGYQFSADFGLFGYKQGMVFAVEP